MTLIVWLAQRTGHQRTDVKTIQASLPVGDQSSAGVGRPWEHLRVLKWKGSSEGQVGGLLKKGLFLLQSLECSGSSRGPHVPRCFGVGGRIYCWCGQGAAWSRLDCLDQKGPSLSCSAAGRGQGRGMKSKKKSVGLAELSYKMYI